MVGHTHVPVIFQQPYTLANEPTEKLNPIDEDTSEMSAVILTSQLAEQEENALLEAGQEATTQIALTVAEESVPLTHLNGNVPADAQNSSLEEGAESAVEVDGQEFVAYEIVEKTTPENDILHAEDRLNDEIEELLELLGLSQSMVQVTNERLVPPEDRWEPPQHYRAIINPGGVGQPRDGDPRAAFMIYDSEQQSFEFHRIPYSFEKTQEKIIQAGLPQYLAVRLAYGR